MIRPLRRSFAAKLTVAGCLLALVVVSGVAGYLIFSRTTQTRAAAESNADNRVGVMAQVLQRFTGTESLNAATGLAHQPLLVAALTAADPAGAVTALLDRGASVDLTNEVLLISDSSGQVVATQRSATDTGPAVTTAPEAIHTALSGGVCQTNEGASVAGGCGVEVLSGGVPAYVVAIPVMSEAQTVGAVACVAPLAYQLQRFQALFGFPTAFISAQHTDLEFRPSLGGTGFTDAALRAALSSRPGGTDPGTPYRAIYDAPTTGGGTAAVAGSFLAVRAAGGELSGYLGVEVPVAQFAGDERTDILVLGLIAIFVLLLVAFVVIVFVERFVKRPISRLERGVARIAGGDYATDIQVRSDDELGRLATNVNLMREAIAGYVRQIEVARERLDAALERVSGVSRALTTTAGGVGALQEAVVRAAAAIGGAPASSVLAVREGPALLPKAAAGGDASLDGWSGVDAVLGGQTVRLEHPERGVLVAVPMFYQDEVVGSLAVITGHEAVAAHGDVDVDVLGVLANNAAIAMENARLFEQERETVQRLLELDSMKTDFLATVQHELRTPLTAILGMSDLLEMCWGMWEDPAKLEAVADIQVAAKNLYDIVETIIDFSAMEDAQLGLHPAAVPLRSTIENVLETVGERYKGGLPVPVDVEGDPGVAVLADPDRLVQVLRALVDNAMKFSDGGGRVAIRFEAIEGGRQVRIEITDQGIGIPAADLPRIFDRFYQVDNSATRKYGGTGMGLALVRRMVQAHHATVRVESTVGEGTTVTLVWPTPEQHEAERDDDEVAAPEGTRSAQPALPVQ